MTGAMYAGISGMRAHMSKLNVIGNNVANVNTVGYKSGFTIFTESLYTTTRGGSNGTNTTGGINPIQTGYGCKIGTVDLDMSTKQYMPTGMALDSMIAGDGFFMVGDKNPSDGPVDPSALMFSRNGHFTFGDDGYLKDGDGNIVYGFLSATNAAGGGNDANYAPGGTPAQTTGVSTQLMPIRLPMAAGPQSVPPAAGEPEEGSTLYPFVTGTGATSLTQDATLGAPVDGTLKRIQLDGVSIGVNGEITGTNSKTGLPVVVGFLALGKVANPSGMTHAGGPYYKPLGGAGEVSVASMGGVVEGRLNNEIATTGDLIASKGDTKLAPGGLESSGADVATEFSEMITTQRGYQANTRIITVTDSMLEELVNLKR